jgi:hypothetical protein
MNRIFGVLFGVAIQLSTCNVFAQAISMQVAMGLDNRNAMMVTMDQPVDTTIHEIQQMLNHLGVNLYLKNGYGDFRAVSMANICADKLDLHVKILPSHNNKSIVYMAVSRGYNSITCKDADSTLASRLGLLLNAYVKNPKGSNSHYQIAKK